MRRMAHSKPSRDNASDRFVGSPQRFTDPWPNDSYCAFLALQACASLGPRPHREQVTTVKEDNGARLASPFVVGAIRIHSLSKAFGFVPMAPPAPPTFAPVRATNAPRRAARTAAQTRGGAGPPWAKFFLRVGPWPTCACVWATNDLYTSTVPLRLGRFNPMSSFTGTQPMLRDAPKDSKWKSSTFVKLALARLGRCRSVLLGCVLLRRELNCLGTGLRTGALAGLGRLRRDCLTGCHNCRSRFGRLYISVHVEYVFLF